MHEVVAAQNYLLKPVVENRTALHRNVVFLSKKSQYLSSQLPFRRSISFENSLWLISRGNTVAWSPEIRPINILR